MLFGSLGACVSMIVPYVYPHLLSLYVSRALTGVTFIFFMVAVQNLVASLGGADMRTRNLSTFSLGQSVSGLLGPVMIGFAIDGFGYKISYLFLGLVALLPVLALIAFPRMIPDAPHSRKKEKTPPNVFDLIRIAPLRRTLLAGAIIFSGVDLLSFYVPIYGHSIGLSATTIGIILGVYAAAAFVVRVFMPALVKRTSEESSDVFAFASGMTYLLFVLPESVDPDAGRVCAGARSGLWPAAVDNSDIQPSPDGRAGRHWGCIVNKSFRSACRWCSVLSGVLWIDTVWVNAVLLVSGGYLNRKADNKSRQS